MRANGSAAQLWNRGIDVATEIGAEEHFVGGEGHSPSIGQHDIEASADRGPHIESVQPASQDQRARAAICRTGAWKILRRIAPFT